MGRDSVAASARREDRPGAAARVRAGRGVRVAERAWAEAARGGVVHDVIVVVAPSGAADDAARLAADLAGRVGRGGRPPVVLGVDEPPGDRRGNLGGTLRAWAAAQVPPDAAALMLHDAGAASRSAGWVSPLDGRRGRLALPGRTSDGRGMRLLEAVARLSSPLAASNPGGVLDVAWTSQLLLPDLDPAAVPAPTADLTKLVMAWDGGVSEVAARELGWFAVAGGAVVGFAPGGTFDGAEALAAWAPERRADVGAFRMTFDWLRWLDEADLGALDLDPGLTGPVVGHTETGGLAALVAARGRPTVGVLELPASSTWRRMRRAEEVAAAMVSLWADAALRRALGVDRPLDGVRLGGVDVTALGWDEVAAGVTVDGVDVRRSILRDVDVATGSLDGVVAVEAWDGEAVRLGAVRVA
jgi:hypothetical protein